MVIVPLAQGVKASIEIYSVLSQTVQNIVTLKQVFFIFVFFQKGLGLILTKHFSIILQSFIRYRGQCCNTFYCSNLLPFHSNAVILCYKATLTW
jgi:hypothetical protein